MANSKASGFIRQGSIGFNGEEKSHPASHQRTGNSNGSSGSRQQDFINARGPSGAPSHFVSKARNCFNQGEGRVNQRSAPLNARAQGQDRRFLKNVFHAVRQSLGLGPGPAPLGEVQWGRPDQRRPDRLSGMLPGARDDQDEFSENVRKQESRLDTDHQIKLRAAVDEKTLVDTMIEVNDSHLGRINETIGNLLARNQELADNKAQAALNRASHSQRSTQAREEVLQLEKDHAAMEHEEDDLSRKFGDNLKDHETSYHELNAVNDQLKKLPDLEALLQRKIALLKERDQVAGNLKENEEFVSDLSHDLSALVPGRDRVQDLLLSVPSGSEDQKKRMQENKLYVKAHLDGFLTSNTCQKSIEYFKKQLEQLDTDIKDIERKLSNGENSDLYNKKKDLEEKVGKLDNEFWPLRSQLCTLRERLKVSQEKLEMAKMSLGEREAQFNRANQQHTLYEEKVTRGTQSLQALMAVKKSAQARTSRLEGQCSKTSINVEGLWPVNQHRVEERLRNGVDSPPGFEDDQCTNNLKKQIDHLVERLEKIPSKLPDDQALELISRSLSAASEGQGLDASKALADLMKRTWMQLVPEPEKDFVGQEGRTQGDGLTDVGAEMKLAMALAALPDGAALLKRLVASGSSSGELQDDAVAVYLRAAQALTQLRAADSAEDKDILEIAQFAAKRIVHEGKQFKELNTSQRIAFNAVRNGFVSFGDSSEYAKANKALSKLAVKWVPGEIKGKPQTSPWHATQRSLAARAAADVGFPTADTPLISKLQEACQALNNIVGRQMDLFPPSQIPDDLHLAKGILKYIQAREAAGEPIDKIRLGKSAWRAINMEIWRSQNRASANRSGLSRILPSVRNNERRPDFMTLSAPAPSSRPAQRWGGQRAEKLTVLEALSLLRNHLAPPDKGRAASSSDSQSVSSDVSSDHDGQGSQPDVQNPEAGVTKKTHSSSEESESSDNNSVGDENDFSKVDRHTRPEVGSEQPITPLPASSSASGETSEAPSLPDVHNLEAGVTENPPSAPTQPSTSDSDSVVDEDEFFDLDEWEEEELFFFDSVQKASELEPDSPLSSTEKAHVANENNEIDETVDGDPLSRASDPNVAADLQDNSVFTPEINSQDKVDARSEDGSTSGDSVNVHQLIREVLQLPAQTNQPLSASQPQPQPQPQPVHTQPAVQFQPAVSVQDPVSGSPLETALQDAAKLKHQSDRFTSSEEGESAVQDFVSFATSVLTSKSGVPHFGSVVFSEGRDFGVSLEGRRERAKTRLTLGRKDQIKIGRDSWGMEMAVGRTHRWAWGAGFSGGSLLSKINTGNAMVSQGGRLDSMVKARASTVLKEGAIIRMPQIDGKTQAELSKEYSAILKTALNWKPPSKDDDYAGPLEALFDQHYSVSVSTFDDARSRSSAAPWRWARLKRAPQDEGMGRVSGGGDNRQLERDAKTTAGAQSLLVNSKTTRYMTGTGSVARVFTGLVAKLAAAVGLGGGQNSQVSQGASWNLQLHHAASGSTLVRQPDGSIKGERFVEHTSFEEFSKAMKPQRQNWIQAGINAMSWDVNVSTADKYRITAEALDNFMAQAQKGMASGTLSYEVSMQVKPDVAMQLNANFALEEIARRDDRREAALALQNARDKILAADSSYTPFSLKAIVRSSPAQSKDWNLKFFSARSQEATATRVFAYFPGGPASAT